ncbi:MAG: glycoside hydrolase family 92 protein, partial [Chitinophagaceae bacterium]
SVIADAYAKGIRNYDSNKAYALSVGSVEKFGNGETGYTPNPLSISYTLEYAYFDWCVAQLAKALGKEEDAVKYAQRSLAYKNIFDAEKGWFRPKLKDGSWEAWPEEGRLKQWYGTMESNAYQQGWFVPQDVPGMVNLMGGKEKVKADLVSFFEKVPQNMMWNDYYNHANEPVHHVPFLFNRLGEPSLTQKWTRAICDRAYKNSVEGLVGNEDVGQMSAWYILAASGLHPVCPGETRYEITSPVFNAITIRLDKKYSKGRSFTIKAVNNNPENIYIQRASLNGKPYNKSFIDHSDLMKGGVLELVMGSKTNEAWGKE